MKAKNKLMERMKRVKLIYDWLAFIVDVFVGYRPEAHLPHSSLHFKNSILSIPELLALFFSFPAEQTASLELSYLLKKEKEEESLVVC